MEKLKYIGDCFESGWHGRYRYLVALLAVITAAPAFAECRINTPDAQLCQSGTAAAAAYLAITDNKLAASDAAASSGELLRRMGCTAAGIKAATLDIEEVIRGPMTLRDQKINVVSVRVDGDAYWYLAENFLTGQCAQRKPTPP